MNNVELFDFSFVDREEQTQKVNSALKSESFKNVIWINGEHGVGKSYFVDHIIKKIPKEFIVHMKLTAEEPTANCMKLLLEKIGDVTKTTFLTFFQKNYQVISEIFQSVIRNVIKNIAKIDMDFLCDALLDSNKVFTTRYKEQENNLKLVVAYFDSILRTQKLAIIIDDLSLCDIRSFNLLTSLLQYYSAAEEKNICFILCTSHGETYNYFEYQLQEKVILESVEIKPFEHYKYFNDILITKFNLASVEPHTLQQIFEFCEGYPERLKTFIHLLYSQNGVIFSDTSDRATWKNEIVEKIIYADDHEYHVKGMSYVEQFVLYVIVEFKKILPLAVITHLVDHLMNKNQFAILNFSQEETIKAILDLKRKGILTIYHNSQEYFVKLEHDLKYYSLHSQFSQDPMMPQINGIFFEYILENQKFLSVHGLSASDNLELLAWHSFHGKATNWIRYNLEFGNSQYYKGNYFDASDVYKRLIEFCPVFDISQNIVIGDSFFRTGHYSLTKSVLENLQTTNKEAAFSISMLLARAENLLFNKPHAIVILDKLLSSDLNEIEHFNALNLKQRILTTVKDGRTKAKLIFDQMKKATPESMRRTAVYGKFLMGTIEFYRGETAAQDLALAEDIALSTDNQYLLGQLYTNTGFHEFWRGNISLAKDYFKKSQDILSSICIHESAYALNNLGACYMMEGELENAMKCFQMGLLWAQSKYVEITLKSQLMACYAIYKNDSCFIFMDELAQVLCDPKITDISIRIKVNYSIGFVHKCYGNLEKFDEYGKRVTDILLSESKDSWPYIWFENYDPDIEKSIGQYVNGGKYPFFYKTRFEPWLVTLSHD